MSFNIEVGDKRVKLPFAILAFFFYPRLFLTLFFRDIQLVQTSLALFWWHGIKTVLFACKSYYVVRIKDLPYCEIKV